MKDSLPTADIICWEQQKKQLNVDYRHDVSLYIRVWKEIRKNQNNEEVLKDLL